MKKISLLGSTGSIGVSTLDVVSRCPGRFGVAALAAAGGNLDLMAEQAHRHRPALVALASSDAVPALRRLVGDGPEIVGGIEGLIRAAAHPEADLVVSAIVGAAGLVPTLAAIHAGKNVALANKETLVMAGEIVMAAARASGVRILPIDSEHSAIFQALAGHRPEDVSRIILTASGGPFRETPMEHLRRVTPRQALRHPTWKMGNKITIDSATLMNKGLEVIEAHWIFGLPPERIDVLIHPQSIVHSLVEFTDGSVIAQLGPPDMRGPIGYALAYPERLDAPFSSLDLTKAGPLTFEPVDSGRFACLRLAREALQAGGTAPAILNAANEIAVRSFLAEEIAFLDIPRVIETTLSRRDHRAASTVEDVLHADRLARTEAESIVKEIGQSVGR
ncbi:MAG: 1-deoxy-D-xylulose-5-phosphate reductoisomerase [Nitrospirae bacterium]|nr:1-deoxy-D-xylulose-5-phosphate reductoisomerase [Nitrospirota bacterium]